MDFAFSEEQEALRASARDYLADRFPLDRVVQLADSDAGWDPATWRELANMGWLDPELGVLEHAVLAEETGFGLLPAPLFATLALAGPLLDEELRSGVAAGERSVTLASAGDVTVSGDRLSGSRRLVPDLTSVTDVVVPTANGVFAVDVAAHPDVVVGRSTVDRTRRLGELRLDNTPARRLDVSIDALTDVRRRSLAWASCEAVGVAQRALDLAADYTKTRQQFGRVIGTYQGVSHRVSNIFVSVQLGRSLAYWAAWAVAEADVQQDVAVAAAKAAATEGAVFSCENAIQAHGGIGFTWEHVLHRFYKRAQWLEAFEGFGRVHRARIAAAILDDAADGEAAA
ncbi:MAG TPA: acyl-CoA dehydrogenase family protein [Mycobacteriales bacterium]|nr:acyl-CoA dehydrogenase family protein [Mycobacteriales bacterium]